MIAVIERNHARSAAFFSGRRLRCVNIRRRGGELSKTQVKQRLPTGSANIYFAAAESTAFDPSIVANFGRSSLPRRTWRLAAT